MEKLRRAGAEKKLTPPLAIAQPVNPIQLALKALKRVMLGE